jgi:uncharacterized protein (TIGR03435 family)
MRTLAIFLTLAASAVAQNDHRPEFEVASIKPTAPGARGMFIRSMPGGRINVTNMTLKELIVIAYRIQPFQISGGPAWLDSIHYDISAKGEDSAKQGDLQPMLQALLADRFQLTIRRETKELPIYALVLAKKDGKLGPKLVESKEGTCTTADPTKPPSPPEPGRPPTMYCGNMRMGFSNLNAVSIPVGRLIPMLARTLGRTIIDKTGLTQNFDITMEWTPDDSQLAQIPPDVPRPAPSNTPGPSIFTALQEQLGLKLESQKGPVEVFVIERAEKPSEN